MTRVLLLSDIHANIVALDAVIADARGQTRFETVWSLGDTVGYGPRPNECIERLRELEAVGVTGNHELAATGSLSPAEFNSYARAAVNWTAEVLTVESREHIAALPMLREIGDFTLVHGSPRDPVWEYVVDGQTAAHSLSTLQTANCVNGHTHLPAVISPGTGDVDDTVIASAGQTFDLGDERRFVNPGSVGQPRDGDPRASYAVLDTQGGNVTFYRVEYAVSETQHQMELAGLPRFLAERLAYGR